MKIVVFSSHTGILPVLDYLNKKIWLKAVINTIKQHTYDKQIAAFCESQQVPFFSVTRYTVNTEMFELLNQIKPDVVLMVGFSYRIPEHVFKIPHYGFLNVHFGLLPAYKGPDPVFWQIRNGETTGGITIHQINNELDAGPVIMQQELPLLPGENWGIYNTRLSFTFLHILQQLLENIQTGQKVNYIPPLNIQGSYNKRPDVPQITIDCKIKSAHDIENLVNAANPVYGGAITSYQVQPLRVLEVSQTEGGVFPDAGSGEVVYHDHTGLYIQCADRKILRINVAKLNDIPLSGFKLGLMGAQKGTKLGTSFLNYRIIN